MIWHDMEGGHVTSKVHQIYALTDPRTGEVRYIGYSSDVGKRYRLHIKPSNNRDETPRSTWIRSLHDLGAQPRVEVIETIRPQIWEAREAFWIRHYRDMGCDLTNISLGGLGGRTLPQGQWAWDFDRCVECGANDREHVALGLCSPCYARKRHRELMQPNRPYYEWSLDYAACGDCGTTERPHKGYGLCDNCLSRQQRRLKREAQPTSPPRWALRHDRCTNCGTTERRHHSKGLCSLCDSRRRNGTIPPVGWAKRHACCVICGTTAHEHQSHGRCSSCNARAWREAQGKVA